MTFDDNLKICADFYRDSEITEAQSLLKCGISMHKSSGSEKNLSTVEDITNVMLNPSTTLPTFYSIDLHILFQFVFIKLVIIIFGHAHLLSCTDSRALRAEYCIGHPQQGISR